MPRPGSSAARGYGSAHVKARAALLPLAAGSPCSICGVVLEAGEDVHLDHNPERTGYRGFAHARCNMRDGAIRGNRARGIGPLGSRSRDW